MKKVSRILILSIIIALGITIKSYAGSFSVSTSASSAEPGSTVTIKVTGNNATGRINLSGSNISLSTSSVWVENGTQTLTGTLTGGDGQKATVTATAQDLCDSTTTDDIKGSKSASVTIKKKEVVVQQQAAPAVSTPQPASQPAAKQNTTTAKKTTTTKKEQKVQETKQEEYVEDQGTYAEFGLSSLYVFGVNENEEKSEIPFTPNFDINTSDYACTVASNIKRLEFDYDANEYRDLVHIEGAENELVAGENIINITMQNTDGTVKQYKLVVTKEAPIEEKKEEQVTENTSLNEKIENKSNKEVKYVKMPLFWFVVTIVGIVVGEAGLIAGIYSIVKRKNNK